MRQILVDALHLDAFAILLILNGMVNHSLGCLVSATLGCWPVCHVDDIQRTVDLVQIILVPRVLNLEARQLMAAIFGGGMIHQAGIVGNVGQS